MTQTQREHKRAYEREYEAKRLKKDPKAYYASVTIRVRKWRKLHPERVTAHRKIFVEVRAGRLVKEPCFCGNPKSEAHHPDYSKPLEVKWYCKRHHRMADRGELTTES